MSFRKQAPLMFALALAGSLTLTVAAPRTAGAQIFQKMKDAAKKKAEEAAAKATSGAKPEDKPAATPAATPAAAAPEKSAEPEAAAPARKKEWANYDFVPGNKVLYYTDFSEDQVGNFPKRLDFQIGQMEVVQLDGGQRALKASTYSTLLVPLPVVLPEKFTIELGVINRNSFSTGATTFDLTWGNKINDHKYTQVGWGHSGMVVSGGELPTAMTTPRVDEYKGKPAMFRVLGDGRALKFYVDDKRMANIPNAVIVRGNKLLIDLQGRDDADNAVYITSIRVAESQKSIYDELAEKGRWATQGILFDVGSATLKGESTPTLKEIAQVLKEHADLKVEIQGHTDNTGAAAANLKLSDERANAVKAALVSEYGVSEAQLTAKGYGVTKPVAPNTTVEGRANNRRVELVKVK